MKVDGAVVKSPKLKLPVGSVVEVRYGLKRLAPNLGGCFLVWPDEATSICAIKSASEPLFTVDTLP